MAAVGPSAMVPLVCLRAGGRLAVTGGVCFDRACAGGCRQGSADVGAAEIVETDAPQIPYLIAAPTMRVPMILKHRVHPYLAARAALLPVRYGACLDGRWQRSPLLLLSDHPEPIMIIQRRNIMRCASVQRREQINYRTLGSGSLASPLWPPQPLPGCRQFGLLRLTRPGQHCCALFEWTRIPAARQGLTFRRDGRIVYLWWAGTFRETVNLTLVCAGEAVAYRMCLPAHG